MTDQALSKSAMPRMTTASFAMVAEIRETPPIQLVLVNQSTRLNPTPRFSATILINGQVVAPY